MTERRGPLAWMARNPVAANLLMAVVLVGGFSAAGHLKEELFPKVDPDVVTASVVYPGASPAEVEQGVLLAIEEAVRGLDGIKRVRSRAVESLGTVGVEVQTGADRQRVLADVKNAVDRITSFPDDAEEPVVRLAETTDEVISLVFHGEVDERTLRRLAEDARDELLATGEVTQVTLRGVRPPEIAIEVAQARLREHGLTLDAVAARVRAASVEVPGGTVDTPGGEVLLRTAERRDTGHEFEDVALLATPSGARLRLGDVARVVDGFRDTDQTARFNDQPAVMVTVYRVGEQGPIEVADTVKVYRERTLPKLPPGVGLAVWNDWSELYRGRLHLMLEDALIGLILVFIILGLFLELRIAFWVSVGIPTSVFGALLLMPALDLSVNMVSLFAFIVAMGILVDDAIVISENTFTNRERGLGPLEAAIAGVREVAVPVTFSVLTSVAAFVPLLLVPGMVGKFFKVIPSVVIPLLLVSLVETMTILPAHLGHRSALAVWLGDLTRRFVPSPLRHAGGGVGRGVVAGQQAFGRLVDWLARRTYAPVARAALRHRYLTVTVAIAALLVSLGLVAGGRVDFTFMPKIDGDVVIARARLPFGVDVARTRAVEKELVAAARAALEDLGGESRLGRGVFAQIGEAMPEMSPLPAPPEAGSHVVDVATLLSPGDARDFTAFDFAREWRARLRDVPGLDSLTFTASVGAGARRAIDLELSHRDTGVLRAAAAEVAHAFAAFEGVSDIDDGFAIGKVQLDLELMAEGRALGLTELDLARQVRAAFHGAEALRQQRGRDEVRVMVRLPAGERSALGVEALMLRAASGAEIPLAEAARITPGRSYTEIQRSDGRRVVDVTADVDVSVANTGKVMDEVTTATLPALAAKYPGLRWSLEGEQRDQRESLESLAGGFLLSLLVIYGLLAIPFRSYGQPVIIMSIIPFGAVGALVGHIVMGHDLSLPSILGIVALSGILVNDSLILVCAINDLRATGMPLDDAIVQGGVSRFRAIMLSSLTNFFGIAPMTFETSLQAKFLVPMAISMGFGVLASTFITLLLVPSVYHALEDVVALGRRVAGRPRDLAGRPADSSLPG
jgi:multidrug efflux pump subunit AcrB